MAKKYRSDEFGESLKKGLKYPWNNASRLLNIFWILLPILGWFALGGYGKKIVRELILKQNKQLPAFGDFWENFKQGIIIFVFMIPTYLVLFLIMLIPFFGRGLYFLALFFLLPWLTMNFFVKETFEALWEVKKAFYIVTNNIVDYLWVLLKTIIFTIIYGLLSIVLVGIPAYAFGKMYFLTEFYKKHKK